MKENMIVLEPFELISVIDVLGKQQVNSHGTIELTGMIRADKKMEYLRKAAGETWVEISAVDEDGLKNPFFCGILDKLKIETEGDGCILTLSASTGTKLMDFENHTRSFQEKGITYKDVIDTCKEGYLQAATIMTVGNETKLPHFYMQYRESDWEFIKRLASSLHTIVVPSCKTKGVKFFFGVPEKKQNAVFELDAFRMEQNWEEYKNKKENSVSLGSSDSICYAVQSREIYELGSNVIYDGRQLCIWKIETQIKGNELIHTYFMKTKSGFRIPELYNEKLIGLTLLGRVTKVKGEMIQMDIDRDENKENTGCCWFQYSTVYSSEDGTGWYCMPEEGDAVRLYFPTENEGGAYAASAVHRNQGAGLRTDPSQKFWRNKEGKEIRLTPDKILLTNNDGLSIELDDSRGIRIRSDKSINLTATDNISISSSSAGLEMNASNRIVLKQGDTKMELADGIHLEGAKVKLE